MVKDIAGAMDSDLTASEFRKLQLSTPPETAPSPIIPDGQTIRPRNPFSNRIGIESIVKCPLGAESLIGQRVRVGGFVKTGRQQGKGSFAFLELNDGSSVANLQVVIEKKVADLTPLVQTGTSILVEGVLKRPPEGTKQRIELHVENVLHVGPVDSSKYPISKTKHTPEYLRDNVHLRPKTTMICAVTRIRDELHYATSIFFKENGFLHVHTPIITTNDCEGAGDTLQATSLLNEVERIEKDLVENPPPSAADVEAALLLVKEKGDYVALLKSNKADKEHINASVAELKQAKKHHSKLVERFNLKPGLPKKDGKIDYTQDFFSRKAFLTVSGQLHLEAYACALGDVYTAGPAFRAEKSHTSRHLAEFWMVEAELIFADLEVNMKCAEAYVKYMCEWLLERCPDELEFMAKQYDKGCIDRLKMVASTPFERISYTEAVDLLVEAVNRGKTFEKSVEWGLDLASEHERYLTEVVFQKPIVVYNYPKGIKAFYMRINDDLKTVAAMDVLVPKVGELIGGSQREERLDVIEQRMAEMGIPTDPYEWYLDPLAWTISEMSFLSLDLQREQMCDFYELEYFCLYNLLEKLPYRKSFKKYSKLFFFLKSLQHLKI